MIKKILFTVALFTFLACKSQVPAKLTFEKLKHDMIDFLVEKKDIDKDRASKLKSGEHTFNLRGVNNNLTEGILKDGMYAFSSFTSHKNAYFVLVENERYIILDISTRKGLDDSIKNTLDFGERNKFCVEIINDYVSRLIGVYYNINNNPRAGHDVNCEKGVTDTKDLP
jgi:hypothetical protein